MHTARQDPSWREGAFVTPHRAAEILGYSTATVRNLIFGESLRAVRLARGGPMLVTTESLAEFIKSAEPIGKEELTRLSQRTARKPNTPRLTIIDGGRR
jgi:hypothetical protein